jgi:WD40 repeat protein/serine/threonine protein kinase
MAAERNETGVSGRLDEVVAAYRRDVAAGRAVDREKLLAQYPDLAAGLESFFRDEERLGCYAAPLQPRTVVLGKGPSAEPSGTLQLAGTVFGDYELLEEIAHGGMGVVYRARQISLNRVVALKMILAGQLASPEAVQRFRGEAEAAAHLDHPNIVPIYEVGERQGQHYFTMKLIEGGSLAQKLSQTRASAQDGPALARRANETARLVSQVARAVHYAHQRGILHRDLKPANILLSPLAPAGRGVGGEGFEPHVTDFGLAKRLTDDAGLTQSGAVVGTPGYMAPEQAVGKRDPAAGGMLSTAADVYSLGAILYELLTGRPPFKGATRLDTLLQVIHDEPPRPRLLQPRLAADLETICLKCIQKEPHRRYPSALALADDLQRFIDGEPIEARPVGPVGRFTRWCRRRPVVAGLSASLALLLIAVAIGATLEAIRYGNVAEAERKQRASADSEREKAEKERADADKARHSAEQAQEREREAGRAKDLALSRKDIALVDMCMAFGVAADRDQDPGEALLWFAHAVRLAGPDPERDRANRVRVQTWSRQLYRPVRALPHEEQVFRGFVFHPGGNYLLTLGAADHAVLWDLAAEQSIPLPGGPRQVTSGVWSPDGRRLALGTENHVELFHFPGGEREDDLAVQGIIRALAFSPDGHYLALADERMARVWDCRGREFVTAALAHPRPVETLTFNGRGDRLVTGCLDMKARIFRVPGGQSDAEPLIAPLPHIWPGDPRDVRSGRRIGTPFIDHDRGLLTVSGHGEVTWWDAATGKPVHVMPGPVEHYFVMSLVASPDGRYFFVGSLGKGHLWDITTGRVGQEIVHRNSIGSAAFSPDGKTLLTASIDGTARLWSVPGGQLLGPPLPHQGAVHVAGFAPDGRVLATAQEGGLVRLWAPPRRDPRDYLVHLDGEISRVRLSPDGRLLIPTGTSSRGCALLSTRVYEAATGKPLGPSLRPGGVVLDAALSPDGRHAATLRAGAATREERLAQLKEGRDPPGQLHVWDWQTGQPAFDPVALPSAARSGDYSPDGHSLCVLCARGQVVLFDAQTGHVRRQWEYGTGRFQVANEYVGNGCVRFSPDGQSILTWGMDETVRVWESATGKARDVVFAHRQKCHDARFSADGRLLATASYDNTARVWDFATGRPRGEPLRHPDWVFAACFSPDGQHLLTACRDGLARLWDWQTGRLVCPPFQHGTEVFDGAFTPDGRYVFTVSHDVTARLWEWHTGKPVSPSRRLAGMGLWAAVTPDGGHALAAGFGDTLFAFHLGDLAPRPDVSADALCLLAEMLSGQRVHDSGAVKLTADEWLQRWHAFHARHPDHWPDVSRSGGD